MKSTVDIDHWDDSFFSLFCQDSEEKNELKQSLPLTKHFKAIMSVSGDQRDARLLLFVNENHHLFIGYYIADESSNFLVSSKPIIEQYYITHQCTQIIGPININIFNSYRYLYESDFDLPWHHRDHKKELDDFINFGFKVEHRWYHISYPSYLVFIRLIYDVLRDALTQKNFKVRSQAPLEEIYPIVMDSYKDMPYFSDPGLSLFKLWNGHLLSYYKDDERVFYYHDNDLKGFCLFKDLGEQHRNRVIFTHIGRVKGIKGISRRMHVEIANRTQFKTILNPPMFDLIYEKSPIFNYLPKKSFKIHSTHVLLSFSF